ncbi:hypothetical protein DRO54_03765, partial [Candidatus Bathyarchaeota archaeon]
MLMLYRRVNFSAIALLTMLFISTFAMAIPLTISISSTGANATVDALSKLSTTAKELLNSGQETVNIIVTATDAKENVISEVNALGGKVTRTYESIEAIAASIPAENLLKLASSPHVKRIFGDNLRYLASAMPPFTYSSI